MAYLIGTDEAGYGPNLGPLVISATVWEVPDGVRADDLYGRLGGCIAARPVPADGNGAVHIAVADSKVLYQPGRGLGLLERGLLPALALLGRRPDTWRAVWDALAPEAAAVGRLLPWYGDYDGPIPVDVDASTILVSADHLRAGLASAGIRLIDVRSRAVFPEEFNGLTERHGTKGDALSRLTLALAAGLVAPLDGAPVSVVCDKHGGRNKYRDLLADHFPDWFIEVRGESRAQSVYRFGPPERRVEIRFCTKAESYLPVALASMASKYLRELAMAAFNAFWCGRLKGLRPTAGYPRDAGRFKAEIAAVQTELGISDRLLWRAR